MKICDNPYFRLGTEIPKRNQLLLIGWSDRKLLAELSPFSRVTKKEILGRT